MNPHFTLPQHSLATAHPAVLITCKQQTELKYTFTITSPFPNTQSTMPASIRTTYAQTLVHSKIEANTFSSHNIVFDFTFFHV